MLTLMVAVDHIYLQCHVLVFDVAEKGNSSVVVERLEQQTWSLS